MKRVVTIHNLTTFPVLARVTINEPYTGPMTIKIGRDPMSTSLESYEDALETAGDFADNGNKKDRARVAMVAAQIGELSEVDGAVRPEAMRRIGILCRALAGVRER